MTIRSKGTHYFLGIQKTPQLNPEAIEPREGPLKEGQELAKSTEPFVMRALVSRLGFREAVEDS